MIGRNCLFSHTHILFSLRHSTAKSYYVNNMVLVHNNQLVPTDCSTWSPTSDTIGHLDILISKFKISNSDTIGEWNTIIYVNESNNRWVFVLLLWQLDIFKRERGCRCAGDVIYHKSYGLLVNNVKLNMYNNLQAHNYIFFKHIK